LRLTNRALTKIARKYGYCSRFGRDYLFSEPDLLGIWQALREPKKVPRAAAVKVAPSGIEKAERKAGLHRQDPQLKEASSARSAPIRAEEVYQHAATAAANEGLFPEA
jgi:hypothetical protein